MFLNILISLLIPFFTWVSLWIHYRWKRMHDSIWDVTVLTESSAGGPSRARVLFCLSLLAKSADTLAHITHTQTLNDNLSHLSHRHPGKVPNHWCAVTVATSSNYLCVFTSDSFTSSFLSTHSLLLWSAPAHITGIHCMAPLKPNPRNSRRASWVHGVGGSLPGLWKAMAHLRIQPKCWLNRWRCALVLCLEVLSQSAVSQ